MKKVAGYLKDVLKEDAIVEKQLRKKIALLKVIKNVLNIKKRAILIEEYEKAYPKEVDTITFLKKFNSGNIYGVEELNKWIKGMQTVADGIKARL